MNIRGGISFPEDKELKIRDSWLPLTPEKPIPTRSNPISVNWDGNQMGRANWQEVTEFSNGYAGEMPNYNGLRQNSNPTRQVVQKGGYYGYDAGLAQKNRMINHIAGSHTQTLHGDSTGWKNDTFTQLLMQNANLITTGNRDPNGSQNMAANSPLMPNSHLHFDCSQRDSTTSDGLLFNNQNHYSGFYPPSNLANRPPILEMHSRVDSNLRDKNPYEPHWDLYSAPAEINTASSVTNILQFAPITPDRVNKLENNQRYH